MVCKLGRGDDCVNGMPHLVDDDLLGEFAQVEEQGDGSIMFELTRAAAFLYRPAKIAKSKQSKPVYVCVT